MALKLSDHYQNELNTFNTNSVEMLVRKDISSLGFPDIENKISLMRSMLNELIAILERVDKVPMVYVDALFSYISSFNANGVNLLNYNPESNGVTVKQAYVRSIDYLYTLILTGLDPDRQWQHVMDFPSLYNILKHKQFEGITTAMAETDQMKTEVTTLKSQSESILSSLQAKGKEISLNDYAKVFSEQSELHSNWDKKKVGSAQIWLIVTLILTLLFIAFVAKINAIYTIDTSSDDSVIITLEYVTRVLIVSFFIYVISFCAKQFNVQQHLSVVNKHRQNTLNSYKLFIDSMGDSDSEVKQALMMEVAKAIYESGQTGYLGSNDKSDGSPSMIEFTKYVGGNK